MQYMIVNTHNPESCAFRTPEDGALLSDPFDRFVDEVAPAAGIKVEGTWVNRPGHEIFVLVDAPDPHAIDDALVDVGLIGRTHTRVLSVLPTQQVEVDTGS